MPAKDHVVHVRCSEDELAVVDELRGGMSRSAWLRGLLRSASPVQARPVASREEALGMLTEMAREGKTAAAIALARELRSERESDEVPEWLK